MWKWRRVLVGNLEMAEDFGVFEPRKTRKTRNETREKIMWNKWNCGGKRVHRRQQRERRRAGLILGRARLCSAGRNGRDFVWRLARHCVDIHMCNRLFWAGMERKIDEGCLAIVFAGRSGLAFFIQTRSANKGFYFRSCGSAGVGPNSA
jgi:hypothetical protein